MIDAYYSLLLTQGPSAGSFNLFDKQDKLIDSFVQGMDVSIVPAKGASRFRLAGETPARPEEIETAEVVVERSRARGRWD